MTSLSCVIFDQKSQTASTEDEAEVRSATTFDSPHALYEAILGHDVGGVERDVIMIEKVQQDAHFSG